MNNNNKHNYIEFVYTQFISFYNNNQIIKNRIVIVYDVRRIHSFLFFPLISFTSKLVNVSFVDFSCFIFIANDSFRYTSVVVVL